jgi:hypothetical protein
MPPVPNDRPRLRLGTLDPGGIAPTVFALIERGVERRPNLARRVRGRIELRFDEEISPARIHFAGSEIVIEDGRWHEADLVVSGRLPDIARLTASPLVGGVPNPATRRGRAALARLANGRVRIAGDRALGRRLLALLEL